VIKIAGIKLYTNKLEDKFRVNNKRIINIDPGYLSLGKFILTTTKNQQQRLHLKKWGFLRSVPSDIKMGVLLPGIGLIRIMPQRNIAKS